MTDHDRHRSEFRNRHSEMTEYNRHRGEFRNCYSEMADHARRRSHFGTAIPKWPTTPGGVAISELPFRNGRPRPGGVTNFRTSFRNDPTRTPAPLSGFRNRHSEISALLPRHCPFESSLRIRAATIPPGVNFGTSIPK
jgi:hypothetical protein